MPLLETKGAASAQGFGGAGAGASGPVTYIEDVFSTYLIKTPGSATAVGSINNAIDLSTKGGMVWLKDRSFAYDHTLVDSQRGVTQRLISNSTAAQASTSTYGFTSFNTNGFTLGAGGGALFDNGSAGTNLVTWTFRKQPKFFDVVTYTGDGVYGRAISHNLESTPGCIIVKRIDSTANWAVWHRSFSNTNDGYMLLNTTSAETNGGYSWWGSAGSSNNSTVFYVGDRSETNASGGTYVAYLFAHNAGGFGLSGTDNVISCGSYTGNGLTDGPVINLSYEPQWVMIKRTDSTSSWALIDIMRGFPNTGSAGNYDNGLLANTSGAEITTILRVKPTSTGFSPVGGDADTNASGGTYIYIAIRRGPMKVPTSGTSVFGLSARTGTGANATVTGSAGVSDAVLIKNRGSAVGDLFASRLTGTGYLETSSTAAEVAAGTTILQANPWDVMDGVKVGTTSTITNASANTYINYLFDRAPSFFDVVCYTGTGSATTFNHNLSVVPEMMIIKRRNDVAGWRVWSTPFGATDALDLNTTSARYNGDVYWGNAGVGGLPSSSIFSVGTNASTNGSGSTYVAYLFATVAGVSKVGSYTGTGALQTVNCGFTGGARFVLIKRTDSTGDWYVWDSARGIVAGNDPHLSLNSTAAEVTTNDSIDTDSTGFIVNQLAATNINVSSATYIYLAIA